MNQKNRIIGLVVLVVILVGAVVYFVVGKKSELTPTGNQQTNLLVPSTPTLTFTQGTKPFVQINFDYTIAKFFNIYRSANATSGWQKIISNFPSNAHTAVDYDYPKSANTLYYRITSVNEQGIEGAPSPVGSVSITSNFTYFQIPELGIKIKVTNDLKDLVYAKSEVQLSGINGLDSATYGLSTQKLISADKYCTAYYGSIGVIFRTNAEITEGPAASYVKVGNFYLSYKTPQAACANESANNLVQQLLPSLKEALKTAQPIGN